MRHLPSKSRWTSCLAAAGSLVFSALLYGAPPRPAVPPTGAPRPGQPPVVNQGPRTPVAPGNNPANSTNGTNTGNGQGNRVNNNPNVNNPNAALQGNGPNTNPNAPNNTPNGPNQNPYAPFNGPVGQAGQTDFGPVNSLNSTIPLGISNATNSTLINDGTGTLGFGATGFANSFPWFLSGPGGFGFNGAGYGPYGFGFANGYNGYGYNGYAGSTYGNPGYYGVGSGGYGLDNLPGGDLYVPDAPPVSAPASVPAASGNRPEVQRQVLENAKMANSLYYQFRENNRAYRARQIARDRASPQVLAKTTLESVPRWLGRDELDPIAGKIAWPGPFETEEFAKYRTSIESALRARSESSSSKEKENEKQTDTAQIVHDNVREMVELLRTHIEELPADEYITARKFLDSIEYVVHKSVPK